MKLIKGSIEQTIAFPILLVSALGTPDHDRFVKISQPDGLGREQYIVLEKDSIVLLCAALMDLAGMTQGSSDHLS